MNASEDWISHQSDAGVRDVHPLQKQESQYGHTHQYRIKGIRYDRQGRKAGLAGGKKDLGPVGVSPCVTDAKMSSREAVRLGEDPRSPH